jgi:hypothetical protein
MPLEQGWWMLVASDAIGATQSLPLVACSPFVSALCDTKITLEGPLANQREAERQIVRKLAAWRRLKPSMAELGASGISPEDREFGQKIKELTAEFRRWLESQQGSYWS